MTGRDPDLFADIGIPGFEMAGTDPYLGGGLDSELDAVVGALHVADPRGDRFARVIRDTFDQLYDGQRTGRWSFGQLYKTEKTHMGTLIEINLQREFDFADGTATDYRIAGIEIDCKYSMKPGGWTLPPEVIGHLALVVTADDEQATWRAGVVRVEEFLLNAGRNRDAKGTLSVTGRARIHWLWPGADRLAPNLFLQLDAATRQEILGATARSGTQHGQARTNQLFRLVQRRIIRRAELATVAQQDDFMKRARGNGGARSHLRDEGILVLGHQEPEPSIARALGLPGPHRGEFVSARVVPARLARGLATRFTAMIDGEEWVLAEPVDPVVAAPDIRVTT